MYKNNARDGRDMIKARRLISKRVKKAFHFKKVLKNELFEISKTWALGKINFGFWASFGLKWAQKP